MDLLLASSNKYIMVRMQDVLPSPLSPQKDTILGVVLLGLFTMSWISLNALSYCSLKMEDVKLFFQ